MIFDKQFLSASHPALAAVLKKISAELAAGLSPSASEAALLYAVASELVEGGIGQRLLNSDPNADVDATGVLSDERTLLAGLRGMNGWVRAYEAKVVLLLTGHAALPRSWVHEALADLITAKRWLNSALLGFCLVSEATNARSLLGQGKGLQAAVELSDKRIREHAIELLPAVRRVVARGGTSGSNASAVDDRLEVTDVAWWSELRAWAANGMSDRDLAGTWLVPVLRRTLALEDALREEEKERE